MSGLGFVIRDVEKWFDAGVGEPVHALRRLNLEIAAGEFVAIVGHNGSGKTTLLRVLSGALRQDRGTITLTNGGDQLTWDECPLWKKARYVYQVNQSPDGGSVGCLSVEENLALSGFRGPRPSWWKPARFEGEGRAAGSVFSVPEIEGRSGAKAEELSQGQRQLLALRLALLRRPALLLLDEHTASLDPRNAERCMEATRDLWRETGSTVLMVTHDLSQALRYSTRVCVMVEGRIDRLIEEPGDVSAPELYQMCMGEYQ